MISSVLWAINVRSNLTTPKWVSPAQISLLNSWLTYPTAYLPSPLEYLIGISNSAGLKQSCGSYLWPAAFAILASWKFMTTPSFHLLRSKILRVSFDSSPSLTFDLSGNLVWLSLQIISESDYSPSSPRLVPWSEPPSSHLDRPSNQLTLFF